MLLSLLETILVMHLLERDKSPQSVSRGDQALSDEKEGNSIFPNFQGGESRNARVDQGAGDTRVKVRVWLISLFWIKHLFRSDSLESVYA